MQQVAHLNFGTRCLYLGAIRVNVQVRKVVTWKMLIQMVLKRINVLLCGHGSPE